MGVLANARSVPFPSEDEQIAVGFARLRRDLAAFCKGYKRSNPDAANLTEVSDFTRKTLGDKGKYDLKVKAAHARPLLAFALHLLRTKPGLIENEQAAMQNGAALDQILTIFRREPDVISEAGNKGPNRTCLSIEIITSQTQELQL